LLDATIFFDFRAVAGDLSLESLDEIIAAAHTQKVFLAHLARGALDFFPPLGFFNRLRTDAGAIDFKKGAIAPIVGLARVAALAAGSRERSTLERLAVAQQTERLLTREDANTLGELFPFLFQLRLESQLRQLASHSPIDNQVKLDALSPVTYRHVKDALVAIKRIQDAVRGVWQLDRLG
jgi:CBS domain-containing protein